MFKELDDENFVDELVGAFVEECQTGILECRRAVEAKDYDAIRCAAHGLKGSAAIFGADVLSETAKKLEYAINVCPFPHWGFLSSMKSYILAWELAFRA